jgi:hypothetical protein
LDWNRRLLIEWPPLFLQILSENWPILQEMDGKTFSNKIAARSFHSDYRTVSIGPNGMRYQNTWICIFDQNSKVFQVITGDQSQNAILKTVIR